MAAARQWSRLSEAEIKLVAQITAVVPAAPLELSKRNRNRIAQFDDPRLFARLIQLPDECFAAAERIIRHVEVFLLPVADGNPRHLFPGGVDGHLHPQTLARDITRLVQTQIGGHFNLHLLCHLIATLMIEDQSGDVTAAQQMLDHASPKTTARHYAATRTRGAQKAFSAALEKRIRSWRTR